MNTKLWTISLLTVATIGAISLPARSQDADKATIQEANQNSVVTGNGNYTEQNARQTSIENGRTGRGNVGTVQRSNQDSDTLGNRNDTIQDVEQTNVENGRGRVNRR